MKDYVIYCIFCGDSVYIGRTTTIKRRMMQHGHPPFWAVLQTVKDENESAERERFWMDHFTSLGVVLLNRRPAVCGFNSRPRELKQLAYLKEQLATADPDKCMLWPFSIRGQKGYGQVPIGEGKADSAHVVAWELTNGPVPKGLGLVLRHKVCSNPLCFNPRHLLLGDHEDNAADAIAEGVHLGPNVGSTAGEKNGRAVLTQAKVMRIRELHEEGMGYRPIARKMGVSRSLVQKIIQGALWGHLLPEVKP